MSTTLVQRLDELSTPVYYTCFFAAITSLLLLDVSGPVLATMLLSLVASLIVIKVFLTQARKSTMNIEKVCKDLPAPGRVSSCTP